MSLSVQLMTNNSPVNKIGKNLTQGNSFSCRLKDDVSVLDPVIIIQTDVNIYNYNYMYIQEFGRYYFIKDIKSINNNIWSVSAHVDVLETYKTQILENQAVIRRQKNLYNLYLDDPEFKAFNTEGIKTVKFKGGSGLTKNLQYILCVNGSYGVNEGGN